VRPVLPVEVLPLDHAQGGHVSACEDGSALAPRRCDQHLGGTRPPGESEHCDEASREIGDETLMLGAINALSGKMRPCVTIRRYLERCGQR
jgi:hypothetical protein